MVKDLSCPKPLSSWNCISQPPSSSFFFEPRSIHSLLTISISLASGLCTFRGQHCLIKILNTTMILCCGVKQDPIEGTPPLKDEASIDFHSRECLKTIGQWGGLPDKIYNQGPVSNKVFKEMSYSTYMPCG